MVGAGAIATDWAMGFIPISFGGVWGSIAIKAAVGYGLGKVAHMAGLSKQNADLIALGGFAAAAQDAWNYLIGKVPGLLQAPSQPAVTGAPAAVPGGTALSGFRRDSYYDGVGVGDLTLYGNSVNNPMYGVSAGMGGMSDIVLYQRP